MSLLIVGHRGAMAHEPENSLQSYALAEQIGVDEIELDVRVSTDGELFLLHDATLDRTAGNDAARGLGPVVNLSMAQLHAAELDSGRGVPTLAEMYDATRTEIQLEMKDPAVVPHLQAFFEAREADAARTVITGFSADALQHASELMPGIRRCIIVHSIAEAEAFDGGWLGLMRHTRAMRLATGFSDLTDDVVAEAHRRGFEVHGWPMRSLDDMRTAIRLGVDGTTADDPALAMQWYRIALAEALAAAS